MKQFILAALMICLTTLAFGQSYYRVNGYYRSNGTYVEPYYRTAPNSTKLDNPSTYPNVTPFTGRVGTVDPYSFYSTPSRRRNGWY